MFDYTVMTTKTIDEAINALEENLKKEKFGVLWKLNINEKLQEKGVELNQAYRVLEVCNPNEAKRVLTHNQLAGYFLPCKIVVYDDQGVTKIGMPKPSILMNLADNSESLKEIALDIEKRLISCIDHSI